MQSVAAILVESVPVPCFGALFLVAPYQLNHPVEAAEEGGYVVREVDQHVVAAGGFPAARQQNGRCVVLLTVIDGTTGRPAAAAERLIPR
jgi:hypothetical protein